MKKFTYLEDGKHKAEELKLESSEDVAITNPATGETLVWNGSTWVNYDLPAKDIDGGSFI